jgi:DNA-binding NtrC family response regulator
VKARKPSRAGADGDITQKLVVLVGDGLDWQAEIETLLVREGHPTHRVGALDRAIPLLDAGSVGAILVAARPLAASDVLFLRRVREVSPRTAIVVVTRTPTDPDLKRAFENGATAFLSWPTSAEALRHAIDRGTPPASRAAAPYRPAAGRTSR